MAIEPQAIPAEDVMFMSRAIQLAREGWYTTHPNPRVGCVIVRDGRIVGEGFHHRTGEPHAEIHALRQAGTSARGATVYTTLEPCNHQGRTPPCSKALIEAGVGRVMVAMQDPDLRVSGTGLIQLEAGGVKTACGLLESEARALNPGFIRRMEQHRPWIRIKSAMSLDGRTATASGESRWITNLAARTDVQHWRAQADALLTGVNSVLADDPAFNVRLSALELGIEGVVRQPVRVILDSHLRTPPEAQILTTGRVLLVCLPDADPCRRALLEARGADIRVLPEWKGKLDLAALFSELAVTVKYDSYWPMILPLMFV